MPTHISTSSTSRSSANVNEDCILEEGPRTRKIARAELVANPQDADASVRVTILHQRKNQNDAWEDCVHFNLRSMSANEEVRLNLTSVATRNLWQWIGVLRTVFEQNGVPFGDQEFVVGSPDEVVLADPARAQALRTLLAREQPEQLLAALVEHAPEDLLNQMSLGRLQQVRQAALAEFETMLGQDLPEAQWQTFLDANQWIFGYGLRYQILRPVTGQPQYGGTNVFGLGAQRGDNLMATEGDLHFTVLVEIKKPQTRLTSDRRYRNGAWLLGGELLGAVSQMQANCQTWGRRALDHDNRDLEREECYTREPKGILVIGSLQELRGDDGNADVKRSTFESFRRNLHNPEIITFDELLARARFIVEHGADVPSPEPPEPITPTEEDLPF